MTLLDAVRRSPPVAHERPLVSCLTGTIPERLPLLLEAMHNLRASDYPNIEHCVAVEGEPAEVDAAVARIEDAAREHGRTVPTYVTRLGRWWSRYLSASLSTVPFQVAQWMASGDYLMWASDDERFDPDHISSLVDLLEATDSDFVYARCRMWRLGGDPSITYEVGAEPPRLGYVTNALYRADLLDYRGFTTHIGSGTDFDQVHHWMQAGASYAMLRRATCSHRIDKQGEGPDYRTARRPLRGHP